MVDLFLDDVKSLLDNGFGDDRILKQICRACEHDEVISNYERNYVRKLAEKHLGKKPEFVQTSVIESKPIIPNPVSTEIQPVQQTHILQTTASKATYSKSKNTKMILGVSGVVLIIILAVAVSLSGIIDTPTKTDVPIVSQPVSLSIQTDLTSYVQKDLISISGVSDTSETVNLSIDNQNGDLVWAEQIRLKDDGQFSTLAIAGGPGWERSGTYTITVDNGVDAKSSTFSFTT